VPAVTTKLVAVAYFCSFKMLFLRLRWGLQTSEDQRKWDETQKYTWEGELRRNDTIDCERWRNVEDKYDFYILFLSFILSFGTLVTDPDLAGARFSTTELFQQFSPPKHLFLTERCIPLKHALLLVNSEGVKRFSGCYCFENWRFTRFSPSFYPHAFKRKNVLHLWVFLLS